MYKLLKQVHKIKRSKFTLFKLLSNNLFLYYNSIQTVFVLKPMTKVQEKLVIQGGTPLKGEVSVGGAKNAVLKLMAAALLCEDVSVIRNVPELSDVEIMLDVLKELGAKVAYNKEEKFLTIDATNLTSVRASDAFVSRMRASFVVLGPLVGRMKEAYVALPGGCQIGERRVNFHIKGLQTLGCECKLDNG